MLPRGRRRCVRACWRTWHQTLCRRALAALARGGGMVCVCVWWWWGGARLVGRAARGLRLERGCLCVAGAGLGRQPGQLLLPPCARPLPCLACPQRCHALAHLPAHLPACLPCLGAGRGAGGAGARRHARPMPRGGEPHQRRVRLLARSGGGCCGGSGVCPPCSRGGPA